MKNHSNAEIESIISDLIQSDPTLSADAIRPVVMRLLSEKPKAFPDERFKAELKQRVFAEIETKETKKSIINYNFMNKFKFTLAASTAVAAAAIILFALPKDQNVLLPGTQQVTRVGENAFGALSELTGPARGQGGGGGGGDASLTAEQQKLAAAAPAGMGGGGADAMIWIPTNYKFVYSGDEFSIESDKMTVYERQKGFARVNLDSILGSFNVESFNIGKFGNAKLDYVTASQDIERGYTLSLDMREGNIYIGQNWERWPMATVDSSQNRLAVEQYPADEALINIANQFLTEYGIDRSAFGEPYVQNFWRQEYARVTDKSSFYVPEQASVVYPTKIEGNEVYDQSGNKTGMYVSVDVRQNRATSVGELSGQRYNASEYGTETDVARILQIVQNGGYQNYYPLYTEANAETEEVQLGNPTTGYVRLWQYINNQSKDLYVPSLIFPVLNPSDRVHIRNVIVPVIKDVLDSQKDEPPIRIMDLPVSTGATEPARDR